MRRIYIFDVDGTLTPSRGKMTKDFAEFFDKWSSDNEYYLVTGSDLEKLKEQLPITYIDRAEGLFTCCGNQFYIDGKLQYENKFEVPRKLKKLLGTILSNSSYPYRYGNHIEDRGSLLNFSIVGRDCTQEQRDEYFDWDRKKGERKIIAQAIREKFPDLDAVIGGQISIDIYPKGKDKSQVIHKLKSLEIPKIPRFDYEYIFIGDRVREGGNDYPLAKVMYEMENCSAAQTLNPKTTQDILEELND